MYETIGLVIEDNIARVEFRRPDDHNAFNEAMHREFAAVLGRLRLDRSIRAILLHAQGKAFIGGGNFDYLRQLRDDPDVRRRSFQEGFDIFQHLHDVAVPVIAAVHGHAFGFGATILTSCDMVVAWEGAKLADPHVRAGIVAGDGGVLSWTAACGVMRAKRMLMTGDAMTMREAWACGLVTDLVATPEETYPAALALAQRVAALPPMAVQGTKRAFNALERHQNGAALEAGMLFEVQTLMSEDLEEALRAASEKRPGVYHHR